LITNESSLQTAARFPVWMIGHETFLSWSAFMIHVHAPFLQFLRFGHSGLNRLAP